MAKKQTKDVVLYVRANRALSERLKVKAESDHRSVASLVLHVLASWLEQDDATERARKALAQYEAGQ